MEPPAAQGGRPGFGRRRALPDDGRQGSTGRTGGDIHAGQSPVATDSLWLQPKRPSWDPAQQVQYLVSEFERLQRELYALWSTTPGLLLGTVASVPTGGQGPDSAGSPAEHPDRPATARGVLGRVVDAATGDQESERVSARVVGIDRSPYFRCSEVSYDGVPADQCSSCGAWYDHGSEHACHPEAGGAA